MTYRGATFLIPLIVHLSSAELARAEETTAGAVASPAAPAAPLANTIDPDLAAAAAEDAASRDTPASVPLAGADVRAEASTGVIMSGSAAEMNPAMSLILDSGLGWYSSERHARQGGHSMGYNGFALQGLELAASANVDPYFRFDLAYQVGADLEEAAVTTTSLPANLQARAGFLMVPFGRQNARHLHTWAFVNPPLMQTRFVAAEHFSGAGCELSVLLPLPWFVTLSADAVNTSELGGFRSSSFASIDSSPSQVTRSVADLAYAGRVESFSELSSDWSLLLGASGATGRAMLAPSEHAALYGADAYLKWRPISRGEGERALSLTLEAVLRDTPTPSDRLRDFGGYAELAAQLTQRWVVGLRAELCDVGQGTPPPAAGPLGRERRGALSLTFLPTHFSKVRIEGDVIDEPARGAPVFAGFLQVEVSAGAHGAHAF